MKKYLFGLIGVCFAVNAFAEGVVLSDTAVSDEETLATTQTTNSYPGQQVNSVAKQQIQPANKTLLANDLSDPLFLIPDNMFLTNTYLSHVDSKLRIGQFVGYGINDNLALHVCVCVCVCVCVGFCGFQRFSCLFILWFADSLTHIFYHICKNKKSKK